MSSQCHIVENAVDEAARAALRARLESAVWKRFEIATCGRYEIAEAHVEPGHADLLVRLASERLGFALAPRAERFTRLRRGDYALYADDHRRWRSLEGCVEVTVDLSESESAEGQIVYVFPDGGALVQQRPGLAAIVDRRTTQVARYERYLGIRFGDREILRFGLVLGTGAEIRS